MKRKLLTLTLTVMLFVLAFAFQSNAANEREYLSEDQNNIKIINHIVYLKETKNGETYYSVRDWFDTDEAVKTTSEIKILEEIDGIPVTKIETDKSYVDIDELYYYQGTDSNKLVKEIKIPSSIKTICRGAFSPFDAVEEITIPSTVEALEDAMTDMESLKKATKEKTGTIKRKCSVCKKSETMAYVYGFKPGKVSKVTIKNHSKNSEYFMATG